jgi:4-hydroxyproline epimerase
MSRSVFKCIDAHTCGNPVRLIVEGAPILHGINMSEKRQFFLNNFDWIRKGLMFEPRGHDMMSGAILFPSHSSENDFSILYIETSGCLPMCGHGTIGAVTIAIQEKLIIPKKPGYLNIETPAGIINITYKQIDEKVNSVKLTNVDSFLAAKKCSIVSNDLGEIFFDVSYGGNYYAIIEPQNNFSGIHNYKAGEIIRYSQEIRKKINKKYPNRFIHPNDSSIRGVSHLLWTGNTLDSCSSSRNAVFYGDKAIDRSPCGTGTSARMAQLYERGDLKIKEQFVHESYIGSKFTGQVERESNVGEFDAIVPSVEGWAKVYGYNKILIDDEDPYAHGFQVI